MLASDSVAYELRCQDRDVHSLLFHFALAMEGKR